MLITIEQSFNIGIPKNMMTYRISQFGAIHNSEPFNKCRSTYVIDCRPEVDNNILDPQNTVDSMFGVSKT